ncbi:MAG: hypothetical protein Q9216_005183 [Gyalolechia sp. 2 TL-2023]
MSIMTNGVEQTLSASLVANDCSKLENDIPETAHMSTSDPNSDDTGSCLSESSFYHEDVFEALRPKIAELCASIGFPPPTSLQRMEGGRYNRIVSIEFDTLEHPPCVLRIPRRPFSMWVPETDVGDPLAIIQLLARNLPVPVVFAFDRSTDNPIGSPYLIQKKLPGIGLHLVYDKLTHSEAMDLIPQIAGVMAKLEAVHFVKNGQLVAPSTMSVRSSKPLLCDVAVGPFSAGRTSSGQHTSLQSMLYSLFDAWIVEETNTKRDFNIDMWKDLRTATDKMSHWELLDGAWPNVLWHWDLKPHNILVEKRGEKWEISGVLDWDELISVPLVLARTPPMWLWLLNDWEPERWDRNFDEFPDTDLDSEEQERKDCFDECIEMHCPGWTGDAYGTGWWVRRLARFGLHKTGFRSAEVKCRLKRFLKEWEVYENKLKAEQLERGAKTVKGAYLNCTGAPHY